MNTRPRKSFRTLPLILMTPFVLATGCSDHGMGPFGGEARLLSLSPEGGATGVDPNAPVHVRFSRPLMSGMEAYAVLHLGELTGPEVEGVWALTGGGTVLLFIPDRPLVAASAHTLHLGGGMMDRSGRPVNFHSRGPHMGGRWATWGMMGGAGHHAAGHLGGRWPHTNGTYGMAFSFTTAP